MNIQILNKKNEDHMAFFFPISKRNFVTIQCLFKICVERGDDVYP